MIEWNKIHYIDCMDEKEGLPSLPDKSIDLGIPDPPWGVGYDPHKTYGVNTPKIDRSHKTKYKDIWNPEWNLKWFHELERICNSIILIVGQGVYIWWIQNTNPIGMFVFYYKNGYGSSKVSRWNAWSPYLVYGKLRNKPQTDVIEGLLKVGINRPKRDNFIHQTKKQPNIFFKLLKQIKPESIIDPFTGSGTFIYVAHMLNIPWIAYEIDPIYKHDIDLRFQTNHNSPKSASYWLKNK